MSQECKAKTMVVGSAGVFVIAIVILLLFVLPASQVGSPPVEAQPPGSMGPGSTPPGASGEWTTRLGLGGYGAGYPGVPPGMPGAPGMPGMGPFGAMGGAQVATAPPAEFKGPPLESERDNPFTPPGVELELALAAATKYGPDWSRMPVTTRVGFVRPERPPRPAPPEPPPPTAKRFLRISSMMWSAGRPIATYEAADGKTGTIQPGDWVEEWQVIEMGQDYVVVKHRDTGEIQRVFLKGK